MRVTERELKRDVELLQRQGHDIKLILEYGTAQAVHNNGKPLTSILTKAGMNTWLDGYNAGITAGSQEAISLLKEMLNCGLINESWGEMFDRANKAIA